MTFTAEVKLSLGIGEQHFRVAEHPHAPGIPFGQEGRAAIVYQVIDEAQTPWALKVFKPQYRVPALVKSAEQMVSHAALPGLQVCRRTVLTATAHRTLLRQHPDLTYAVLMPWIEGPTWMEVVMTRTVLSPEASLALAQSLAEVLTNMEEHGLAHCDLSGGNLLIPYLVKEKRASMTNVALVDVEQLYAAGLQRPQILTSGSAGYGFPIAEGVWQADADRFAGAILLGEILGWCDERVRAEAWEESYFEPRQLQRPSERFTLLTAVLRERWGEGVARLFEQAWNGISLSACPTFADWLIALPATVAISGKEAFSSEPITPKHEIFDARTYVKTTVPPETETQRSDMAWTIRDYTERAAQREENGDTQGALADYHAARVLATTPAAQAELGTIIEDLESQGQTTSGQMQNVPLLCPKCEQEIQSTWVNCPHCGRVLHAEAASTQQHDAGEDAEPKRKNHVPGWAWAVGGFVVLAVLVGIWVARSLPGQPVLPQEIDFEVFADKEWQDTGIRLDTDDEVIIEYVSGTWTSWEGSISPHSGNGPVDKYTCANVIDASQCVEPIPDFQVGALVGRVGSQLLKVGNRLTATVNSAGNLELRINDGDPGLYDNAGSIVVRITFP